jgi:undecaprenyl diphosphate synthase
LKSDTEPNNQDELHRLKARLDPARLPAHVAIIMDGNGRWARTQGQDRLFGHWQGYRTLKEIVSAADEFGVKALTVFGFSTENWRRPEAEVGGLMELMQAAMQAEIEELIQNHIRIQVSGRLNELPDSLRETFESAMLRTAGFSRMTFNLAINYGGRAEIADAARTLAEAVQRGEISPDEITEESLTANMYAPSLPDPDLEFFALGHCLFRDLGDTNAVAGLHSGASCRRAGRLRAARSQVWCGCSFPGISCV